MTDNEIIKALECCSTSKVNCTNCPYDGDDLLRPCSCNLMKDAIDLINRQKAENERLQARAILLDAIEDTIYPLPFETDYDKAIKKAKAEAVKEFAERLKEKSEHFDLEKENFVSETDIDNLVKEMVGEG